MQIWWINILQWKEGKQQRDTGRIRSDRAMKIFFLPQPLIFQLHTYMLTHTYRSPETHLYAHTHTKHTNQFSLSWRPSLDKRKTALSRAAMQLFSVVKHVSVWQSKLLFRFAVPDTDRAFKIWGEASRHCSRRCKRYQQLFTPLCVLVFTDDFTHACVLCIYVQIAAFCCS